MSEKEGKWKDLLVSKYDMVAGNFRVHVKYQSWWWRDLSKVYCERGGVGWFQEALRWKIGSGGKDRFWEDGWIDNCNLKTLFPMVFSLSLNQGLKVGEVEGGKRQYGIDVLGGDVKGSNGNLCWRLICIHIYLVPLLIGR